MFACIHTLTNQRSFITVKLRTLSANTVHHHHRNNTSHIKLSPLALQEQPNLRTRLDDAFLLRFLRARKFDYDRALQLLLNYHAGRKAWPEVFQDLKPSAVKHVLDLGFLTVLPRPDPNGRYILCLRPGWVIYLFIFNLVFFAGGVLFIFFGM